MSDHKGWHVVKVVAAYALKHYTGRHHVLVVLSCKIKVALFHVTVTCTMLRFLLCLLAFKLLNVWYHERSQTRMVPKLNGVAQIVVLKVPFSRDQFTAAAELIQDLRKNLETYLMSHTVLLLNEVILLHYDRDL